MPNDPIQPIQPWKPDYFDHVGRGFLMVLYVFGIILYWLAIIISIVFGWPFALLSWLWDWFRE